MKIAIDAGHSKITAGKRAFDSTFYEYEFNRDVSARLKRHLKRHGIDVLLTAPTDADVSLSKRCKLANAAKCDYFVSIHANAWGNTWNAANGWEIYCLSLGGQAESLCRAIHGESIPVLGLTDRGVKTANFQVLRDTNMPAVLIEHGFYSNREELAKLKSDEFREKCAICDCKGILRHVGIAWMEEKDVAEYTKISSDLHMEAIPIADFKITYWDKPKKTSKIKNYSNCGYFAAFKEGKEKFTLPVANLVADIDISAVKPIAMHYLRERGEIKNDKLYYDCLAPGNQQFRGKYPHTLVIDSNNKASIMRVNALTGREKFAVSGAPVMIGGKDMSWKNDVLGQGFDGSIAYATWHGFIGLKGDGFVYRIGMKTKTKNCFTSSEAFNALKSLGFVDVIKVDGGGSFVMDVEGKNVAVTWENRVVGNVMGRY